MAEYLLKSQRVNKKKNSKNNRNKKITLEEKLILYKYLCKTIGIKNIQILTKKGMKSPEYEGVDENNISKFYYFLTSGIFEMPDLPYDKILEYDNNIVSHTLKINENRHEKVSWKYFQYLSLLFTEIYLDNYFYDSEKLLNDLNECVSEYNIKNKDNDKISPYSLDDLNKIAFWIATGAGKTLLMHINILQYLFYLNKYKKSNELNKIILLTPNEGLSQQHLNEFQISGFNAELFNKNQMSISFGVGKLIEIIDIHKLKDDAGDKTVAIDSFESNNLVLVDEGHRGSSGIEWKIKRDKLSENGFSFEYSATFGQAIKASNKKNLEDEYAKCILFDYSYKYFYRDGYGKEYQILNLSDDSNETNRNLYLTACLLKYYQQIKLYKNNKQEFQIYNIEKPLWIFVGGRVIKSSKIDMSDVQDILSFINDFINEKSISINNIERLLKGKSGLLNNKHRDIFENAFVYLSKLDLNADDMYKDILFEIFNSSHSGASLHIDNLKGATGEIGLRIGENEYFGVINVGDDSKLVKNCATAGFSTFDNDFADSLFHKINEKESTINLLIGSRKFTEGWNSWRVSVMGLMNIGKKEGSQIIQLFGRGVRLKGYNMSLKRSSFFETGKRINPEFISILETLNIFGVKAEYMAQFKEYLEEEGLPINENIEEIILPVISNLDKVKAKLKILKIKDGVNFKKYGKKPTLDLPEDYFYRNKIVLNLYPKIQSIDSKKRDNVEVVLNKEYFTEKQIAFLDLDEIYFELIKYKNERSLYNLNLVKNRLSDILKNKNWYELLIPENEFQLTDFHSIFRLQEIAKSLLKKYCDRYYNYYRNLYEKDKMEYINLKEYEDQLKAEGKKGNIIDEYILQVEESQTMLIENLKKLQKSLQSAKLTNFEFGTFSTILFEKHLYQPLIHITGNLVKVSPVSLNEGEKDFVNDLKNYYQRNNVFFEDKELYLLRNLSRGRGVSFFEANNFHPDFILWLITDSKQYVNFIDPKGIRNLSGLEDPKIQLHKNIKELETNLKNEDIVLNSFIVSVTPYYNMNHVASKNQYEDNNVFFQFDDKDTYINKLFNRIISKSDDSGV